MFLFANIMCSSDFNKEVLSKRVSLFVAQIDLFSNQR